MVSDSDSDYDDIASKKKKSMFKMRKYRAALSKEDRERVKANDRNRKALKERQMSEDEKAARREKDKQRKAKERAQMRERQGKEKNSHLTGYGLEEQEHNRQYKIRIRKDRTHEEVEYDNIKALIREKKFRKNRTKEQHNRDKEKAQEGMRQGRYYGYLRDEIKRSKTKFKSVDRLWRDFWDSSDAAKELLKKMEPEIAEKMEEEDRNEPELAAKLAAEDKAKEEKLKKLNSERIKAWRKKKRMDLQKALNEPIIMPQFEKSEYEKIRDENVRQLEEARQFLIHCNTKLRQKIFWASFLFIIV